MKTTILYFFLGIVIQINVSSACTIIVAGKKATTDGSVLVSHSDGGSDCRLRVIPSFTYPKGTMAPVYWGIQDIRPLDSLGEIIGYIPQVEKTFSYIHSALPHINEHQLAIGESTMSQRAELKYKRLDGEQIMTVEQAEIFALQRCTTAAEAVKLIGYLMETYGFLPSCVDESEALAIADPKEVWIFEVFSVGAWKKNSGKPGCIWAAKRVPDDHVAMVPNWSTLKEIDTTQAGCLASPNYKQFAIEKGWYDPRSGFPFVWQKAYAPTPREWATGRFWLFYSTWAPNYAEYPERKLKSPFDGMNPYIQYVEDIAMYPFSVKPEKQISHQDIFHFFRSTFEGTIYDMTSDPDWYIPGPDGKMILSPLATPFPTREMQKLLDLNWRRNVARGGFGMVAQLRSWLPNCIGGIYWVYLDNQVVSPFMPVYAGVQKINPLYQTYDPKKYSDKSARWAYDFVDNLMYLKWQDAWKDVKPIRDSLELATAGEMKELEQKALELYKKNPEKAKEMLTQFVWKKMDQYVETYIDLRNLLIMKYTNNKQGINF